MFRRLKLESTLTDKIMCSEEVSFKSLLNFAREQASRSRRGSRFHAAGAYAKLLLAIALMALDKPNAHGHRAVASMGGVDACAASQKYIQVLGHLGPYDVQILYRYRSLK